MTRAIRPFLRIVAGAFALCTAVALSGQTPASEAAPFSTRLTTGQTSAAGLQKLTSAEREALDAAIARELALARQGGVRGFSTPFSERQPADVRARSGLDRLTPAERHALDEAIAGAMTATFVQPLSPRTLLTGPLETVPAPNRIHGSMTLMYGVGSGGSSGYGASMAVTYLDPRDRFSATVVYSTYRGDLFVDDRPSVSVRTGPGDRRRR
jgi:hypothetical protein